MAPMRKPRNSLAAFKSLRRETSIMPFSLSHSNRALSMDLDRLRYGGCGFERNHKGERAAATAKGDLAMRAGARERMIRIMATIMLVLVISIGFLVPKAA